MDLFDLNEAQNQSDKRKKIADLEKKIVRYQKSYYNGEGEISDAEFDKLWDELKALDPSNSILHKVGADSGNFAKAEHVMPMGSQEKAADPEQFLAWAEKHAYSEYLVEYKLDGASLELQYQNGILQRAVTRGDGSAGDVITENAKKMNGVWKQIYTAEGIPVDFTGGIRGEVIMTHQVHDTLFADKANCRNAANGLMKRKDGEGSENLTLITYDVWSTTGIQPFTDEEDKINWLKKCGFNSVPLTICRSAGEVIDYRAKVMEARKNLDYDIDGLVIKERSVNHEDASRARPDRQIAFKFSLEEAVSVLREVEWNEAGATYTPVAVFDAVDLNGTTVQRASLVNPNTIRALGLKIGSHVVVVKRGEIIPKITGVVQEEEVSGDEKKDIVQPSVCSTCGAALVDEGTRLFCPNRNCRKRILHQLLKWIDCADIRDLGETLITSLFSSQTVKCISDIYRLDPETLRPYFLNEKSMEEEKLSLGAEKVYASIQNHKNISLPKFIAGLDIEGFGETQAEKLIAGGINTLKKMLEAKPEEIASIYGFAEIMALNFVQGMNENREEIKKLAEYVTVKEAAQGKLSGMTFCFTGELHKMKRSDAENLVKENGGLAKSSVVKGLSYLVTNDTESGSSKNLKAQKLGIPVINEEQFLELLGKGEVS